jgi:hypothetical protein
MIRRSFVIGRQLNDVLDDACRAYLFTDDMKIRAGNNVASELVGNLLEYPLTTAELESFRPENVLTFGEVSCKPDLSRREAAASPGGDSVISSIRSLQDALKDSLFGPIILLLSRSVRDQLAIISSIHAFCESRGFPKQKDYFVIDLLFRIISSSNVVEAHAFQQWIDDSSPGGVKLSSGRVLTDKDTAVTQSLNFINSLLYDDDDDDDDDMAEDESTDSNIADEPVKATMLSPTEIAKILIAYVNSKGGSIGTVQLKNLYESPEGSGVKHAIEEQFGGKVKKFIDQHCRSIRFDTSTSTIRLQ